MIKVTGSAPQGEKMSARSIIATLLPTIHFIWEFGAALNNASLQYSLSLHLKFGWKMELTSLPSCGQILRSFLNLKFPLKVKLLEGGTNPLLSKLQHIKGMYMTSYSELRLIRERIILR